MGKTCYNNSDHEITVLGGQVRLAQIPDGLRTSIDSVLLAAACPAKPGDHILDLGCGVGSAGLCILSRVPETQLIGIDIQDDHLEIARKNAALNNFAHNTKFLSNSVLDYVKYKNGSTTKPFFDHIICNPPYYETGTHKISPKIKIATACDHTGSDAALKDWLDCAHRSLKNDGSLTIIHRAEQTDKIIQGLGKRFGAIEIIPLWPKSGQSAKRVIIRALKDRRSPAQIHPGLTLHEISGEYTTETENILRGGAALL